MRPSPRMRAGLSALVLVFAASCDTLMVEPIDPAPEVTLALAPATTSHGSTYGDLTPGLASASRVWFQLGHDGVTRDTTVRALRDGEVLRTRIMLRPEEARGWLEVRAELRVESGAPLFSGHGLVDARATTPRADIELVPIGYDVFWADLPIFTSLGVTRTPAAYATFVTSAPIEGAVIEWTSDAPSIVEVVGDALVSRSNGSATVTASSHGAQRSRLVHVRQTPVALTGLAPADTTVSSGDSFQARAFGQDANGFPLLPGANVTWSATGAVTVDADGVVTAQSAGGGTLQVTFGATTYQTGVTVVP